MMQYLEQVYNHIPLAAIANQITSEVTNKTVIERTASFLN